VSDELPDRESINGFFLGWSWHWMLNCMIGGAVTNETIQWTMRETLQDHQRKLTI
jgi:hypothetical protein